MKTAEQAISNAFVKPRDNLTYTWSTYAVILPSWSHSQSTWIELNATGKTRPAIYSEVLRH